MVASFDVFWPEIASHLDRTLTPVAHDDWLRQFLRFIPASTSEFLGFETRLGSRDGPTDCALNLNPAALEWLAGRTAGVAAPTGAVWDNIRAFLDLWSATSLKPGTDLTRIWLEFDQAFDPLGTPAMLPNLMFGYFPGGHDPLRTREWLIDRAIPAALGAPLPAPTRARLEAGLDHCAEADDVQIGLMSARAIPAVRLCVFDLAPEALPTLARAVGWEGDVSRIAALVEAFRPHADFVGLHFDIAHTALPRIGIEPGFTASSWARQPHREPRWQGQLDVLAAEGALTPEKREALLGWPGHEVLTLGSRPVALLRGLSHLKLVLDGDGDGDGGAEGKAYYGVAIRDFAEEHGTADGDAVAA